MFSDLTQIKLEFNQAFYLNIRNYEFHYALYPIGSHYDKHFDQHKGQSQRVITLVHYLNPNWNTECGGRLLMYDPTLPEKVFLSIEPKFGRTVLFLSDVFPHEVEISSQERLSFTGWFRND
jgi:SM-20-related protein